MGNLVSVNGNNLTPSDNNLIEHLELLGNSDIATKIPSMNAINSINNLSNSDLNSLINIGSIDTQNLQQLSSLVDNPILKCLTYNNGTLIVSCPIQFNTNTSIYGNLNVYANKQTTNPVISFNPGNGGFYINSLDSLSSNGDINIQGKSVLNTINNTRGISYSDNLGSCQGLNGSGISGGTTSIDSNLVVGNNKTNTGFYVRGPIFSNNPPVANSGWGGCW